MKKIIIVAIMLISSTQIFAQNNNYGDRFSYNKEGLTQENIDIRENAIKQILAEENMNAQKTANKNESSNTQKDVSIRRTEGVDGVDGFNMPPARKATKKEAVGNPSKSISNSTK